MELVCDILEVECVIPLLLRGGALAVNCYVVKEWMCSWTLEACPAHWIDTPKIDGMHLCGQTPNWHKAAPPGMDNMTLGQLLSRAQAIMSDEKGDPITAQPVKASTSPTSPDKSAPHVMVTCYKCSRLNHFSRDCQHQHGEGCSSPCEKCKRLCHFRWWKISYITSKCLGNRERGKILTVLKRYSP